jgi:survival-of-motor-neuron-related-splicing factor 30
LYYIKEYFSLIFCRYYEATIDSISEDGVVNITFNEYKNTDVTMLSQLKSVAKRPASDWADQKSK